MSLDELDRFLELLKEYERRYPSDAAKYLIGDVQRKTEEAVKALIL